jgi:hypothetical protein
VEEKKAKEKEEVERKKAAEEACWISVPQVPHVSQQQP